MEKQQKILEMAKDICRVKLNCNDVCNPISACDALKYAERAVEAGYSKQEWISVEERLPSEDEQRDEYEELVPFLVVERDTKYPYRAFYDGNEWGDGLMKIRGITHWMPLPDPPKGGAE
jgi:hypothetical protein